MSICEICGNEYEKSKYGSKRKYCYECSPSILKGSTAISYIRRAIKKTVSII